MKKTLLAIVLTACCFAQVEAQGERTFRIGVEAGATLSNYIGDNRYVNDGFFVGVRGEKDFSKFFVSAGLRFIQKGSDESNGDDGGGEGYIRAHYLEMPVTIGKAWSLGKRWSFVGETGPYFAYGIGGKVKGSNSDTGKLYEWNRPFFSDSNGSPCRFDFGWNARVGLRYRSFNVSLGYEIGFTPVWGVSDTYLSNTDCRNSCFTFGVGYMF